MQGPERRFAPSQTSRSSASAALAALLYKVVQVNFTPKTYELGNLFDSFLSYNHTSEFLFGVGWVLLPVLLCLGLPANP